MPGKPSPVVLGAPEFSGLALDLSGVLSGGAAPEVFFCETHREPFVQEAEPVYFWRLDDLFGGRASLLPSAVAGHEAENPSTTNL